VALLVATLPQWVEHQSAARLAAREAARAVAVAEDPVAAQATAEAGQLIHGLLGWEKLIPESMAMYGAGQPSFRIASKPEPEARAYDVSELASLPESALTAVLEAGTRRSTDAA
jgi:hypothetical protein